MKHILVAVAFSALPATVLAQSVLCHACDHVAPYFRGEGGFIATVAEGADEVTFVASCGNVTTTGEIAPGGGTVAQLFTYRNGLACDGDDGSLEIAGVTDGGWYWITDDVSSAVGALISKDVLDNDTVDITSAGAGVTMTAGKGAVYLKETATGRVGILPNILPEPPMDSLRLCGANDRGSSGTSATAVASAANARYTRRTTECALGDGGTITLATIENTLTGATTRVMDKASVVRPSGTGTVTVTVDLWGNGSGHFTTSADGHALLGNPAIGLTPLRAVGRLTGITYSATLGSGPTADPLANGTELGGVTMDDSTTTSVVTFTIGRDTDYCATNPPRNVSVPVSVSALMAAATSATQVTPSIVQTNGRAVADGGTVGSTSFTIVCP